jgi:hypothetical protein
MTFKDNYKEYRNVVEKALTDLQRKFGEAPKEDWQSSQAWEAIEKAKGDLEFYFWNAFNDPYKPEDFRHWRDKYSDEPLGTEPIGLQDLTRRYWPPQA